MTFLKYFFRPVENHVSISNDLSNDVELSEPQQTNDDLAVEQSAIFKKHTPKPIFRLVLKLHFSMVLNANLKLMVN